MNTQTDCPICMEIIDFKKNCVTTECGHCFHTNCLMTSVAHNGFGCPYCRTAMAEEIQEEEEDDEEDYYEEYDEDEEEMFTDDSLRAFRFFMNNITGDEHDQADIDEEESDEEETEEEEDSIPSAEFLAKKMVEDGVTMEQMVKAILLSHAEYEDNEEFERVDSELYGKLRIIISNYTPEQNNEPPKLDRQNIEMSGMHPFITQRFNRVI
jgi:hypothetical protein